MHACLKRNAALAAASGLAALLIAGCPEPIDPPGGKPVPAGPAKLVAFDSAGDLLDYFKGQARARRTANGGFFRDLMATGPRAFAAEDAALGAPEADGSVSTTNTQEAGVDESDVVKSDGTHLFIARGQTLSIVRAAPLVEMATVGVIEFGEAVHSIYLRGDKILVLTHTFGRDPFPDALVPEIWPPFHVGGTAVVYEVDVSNPSEPRATRRVELDGSLAASRLIGDRLILVLSAAPAMPDNPSLLEIERMTLDAVLPMMRSGGGESAAVPWENWLRPDAPDGYFTTTIVTLNADDIEQLVGSVALMSNAGTIYVSTEALYVTDAQHDPDDNYRERTAVHKFVFGEDGAARYVGSGSVPGRLLNQFSLGEHEGALRVATHVSDAGFIVDGFGEDTIAISVGAAVGDSGTAQSSTAPPRPYNAVFVLALREQALEVVGEIRNIAPGERIFSARFMAERGFLVTFRRVDPLFVLDLSDPAAPFIAGELKIPGFSDYLHPVGDTHLIGVGRSTEITPWGGVVPKGLQLSLFDISDMSNPTLVQQIELGGRGSVSDVSRTHKAFTYLPESGVMAVPADLRKPVEDPFDFSDTSIFDGVLVYRVDPSVGFISLGSVESVQDPESFGFGYTAWRRAAIIGDNVYAITPAGVRGAAMSDFETTHEAELPPLSDHP